MDDEPGLYKNSYFWLMVAMGFALGMPAGYVFTLQMAG